MFKLSDNFFIYVASVEPPSLLTGSAFVESQGFKNEIIKRMSQKFGYHYPEPDFASHRCSKYLSKAPIFAWHCSVPECQHVVEVVNRGRQLCLHLTITSCSSAMTSIYDEPIPGTTLKNLIEQDDFLRKFMGMIRRRYATRPPRLFLVVMTNNS